VHPKNVLVASVVHGISCLFSLFLVLTLHAYTNKCQHQYQYQKSKVENGAQLILWVHIILLFVNIQIQSTHAYQRRVKLPSQEIYLNIHVPINPVSKSMCWRCRLAISRAGILDDVKTMLVIQLFSNFFRRIFDGPCFLSCVESKNIRGKAIGIHLNIIFRV
jgi:hypothetical protein